MDPLDRSTGMARPLRSHSPPWPRRDVIMSRRGQRAIATLPLKSGMRAGFPEMNCTASAGEVNLGSVREPVNKMDISEYNDAITKTSSAIEGYRFNEAADALYQFIYTATVTGMSS